VRRRKNRRGRKQDEEVGTSTRGRSNSFQKKAFDTVPARTSISWFLKTNTSVFGAPDSD
jgi:hypothetical protein